MRDNLSADPSGAVPALDSAPEATDSALQVGATPPRLLPGIHGPADLRRLDLAELELLAAEIRAVICAQVAESGGHLASNLGVVEITLALHYCFDFAHDRLLFDVGHQCYPHKLVTGRQAAFSRLRSRDGLSGFPEPRESAYDLFSVGHAGTAISTAVGMARGDTLTGEGDRRVVALVGDASIVNGLALEGLNNAGTLERQLLVVLNDNGMSIGQPQGAVARRLAAIEIRTHGHDNKNGHGNGNGNGRKGRNGNGHGAGGHDPSGDLLAALHHPAGCFSSFGLECVGPVDGHDLAGLIELFRAARDHQRPLLVHCKTEKGRGFDFSRDDPTTFHSPHPFVVEGCRVSVRPGGRSFTAAFSDGLAALMEEDEEIVAVTAAMPDGTGLARLAEWFPERTFDTGICEGHAMDMCAGMARAGLKPFFAVYSTFAQRALDQAFQEVALQGLPVRVCMDRAGYVGGDGAVHHGFMDMALFRPLPGAVCLAAADEPNLRAALAFLAGYEAGPTFLRYPRGGVATPPLAAEVAPYALGRATLVRPAPEGRPEVAILALGPMVYEAAAALDRLPGANVALYDGRFAKPVDVALLEELIRGGTAILTVEDHARTGGFGAAVLEACNDHRLATDRIHRLAMPDRWVY